MLNEAEIQAKANDCFYQLAATYLDHSPHDLIRVFLRFLASRTDFLTGQPLSEARATLLTALDSTVDHMQKLRVEKERAEKAAKERVAAQRLHQARVEKEREARLLQK